ncbi:helix-turn-helix domain-containing protein [Crossiella sp. CA-258035]|uniref:helix-turn-helix domain-containing protein n=1 Tax=Crossiella sp. CA-258035 TaxID=2981138 RepID=UPI0024BC8490|nr:helix-turn-helix domain-containing protein [Crossiella sp. CA-258035]WHT15684.1 helix-turn-helix domain-containing protein [Crossiella sp. CA-258035]
MDDELYTVEHVANVLGLHVKTVRNYVREGRLKAVRIGKQYRIARRDLEALTGRAAEPPARETAARHRHAEASTVVQIDAISFELMSAVSGALTASLQGRDFSAPAMRVQTYYDQERASMKIILNGPVGDTAALLDLVDRLVTR